MTWPTTPARFVLTEVDERGLRPGEEGELLSVSEYRGVIPRSTSASEQAASEDTSHYKRCGPGQLVLNRLWAFRGGLGVSELTGLVSPDYAVFDIDGSMDPRFVHYQTRSTWFVAEMTKRLRGIGSPDASSGRAPRINVADLGRIEMYTPPLETQRRVVDRLEAETKRIDRLLEKNERVLALLDSRRLRVIYDAVHGVGGLEMRSADLPWCKQLPEAWPTIPLGALTHHEYGYPFPSEGFRSVPSEVPVVRIRDVVPNRVETWFHGEDEVPSGCWVDNGALVIGMDGLFNSVVWHGGRAALNQRVCTYAPMDPTQLTPEFLALAIRFPLQHLNETTYSTTVKHLSFQDLDAQRVPLPPPPLQRQIVEAVEREEGPMAALASRVTAQSELLQLRRASLVSAAVSGELDV